MPPWRDGPDARLVVECRIMFEVDQLACQRGERLLFRNLGFRLEGGALLRVMGRNGVGKTSLLRLLAGLAVPAAGSIRWNGGEIARCREEFHAALLYLGHAVALNDLLTPLENLLFAAAAAGLGRDPARCMEALRQSGLDAQRDLPCMVLSQGQHRRVVLARLYLAGAPRLWLLDEPFTSLDQTAAAHLCERVDAHCKQGGMVVFTSHQDMHFATQHAQLDIERFAP